MQRAGVLIAVTAAASDSRPTTLEGVSRAYSTALRPHVRVPEADRDDVLRHLRAQRLWKRYPTLRGEDELSPEAEVELQDLWLADPRVPASTGAITDDVIDEPPQLASSIQLIRAKNFTRTDRGRALLALSKGKYKGALATGIRDSETATSNLFLLPLGTQAFLAHTLLDADLDFMRAAYEVAPLAGEEFTRAEFADELNAACRLLRSRWTRLARTGTERRLLARLDEWARQIDKPRRSGRQWGGGRPPDQLATLRLEPYVDFGLINRVSRTAYRYHRTPAQRTFFEDMVGEEDPDAFLNGRFVGRFLAALGHEAQLVDRDLIWDRIRDAYNTLRSALGFASFREVTLLAISQLLNEGGERYFELDDGLDVIRERQKEQPQLIRFGVRRGGGLTYMKVVEGRDG